MASAELLIGYAARAGEERVSKQTSLFGSDDIAEAPRLAAAAPWPIFERLQHEAEAVGFYLSGHPLDPYASILKRARVIPYAELQNDPRRLARAVQLAGTVVKKQERRSQSTDQPFAFVEFTEPTGHFEAVIFSDLLRAHREDLEPGKAVVIGASAEWEGEDIKLRVQSIKALDALAAETSAALRIHIDTPAPLPSIATQLKAKGKGRVSFVVLGEGGREIEVELAEKLSNQSAH